MKLPLDLKHEAVKRAINATGTHIPKISNTVKPVVPQPPKVPTAGVIKRASLESTLVLGGMGIGGIKGARKPIADSDKDPKVITNTGKYGLIGGGLGYATAKALRHLTPQNIADHLHQL